MSYNFMMISRRRFLKAAVVTGVVTPLVGVSYGFAETGKVRIERQKIALPNLPEEFRGTRIAFLTDIHHGPYISLELVQAIVRTTMALDPDIIIHGGDYSLRETAYIRPCFEQLKFLSAPLGTYGVMGNHDYSHGPTETREGMQLAKISELTNKGVWLKRGNARLRICGVDDLWRGKPRMEDALGDSTATDAVIVVSHNPDMAEKTTDARVGLMLSGHTHGGQVYLPGIANPFVPSIYGSKYAKGLVQAPVTQVYISRGLGVTSIPLRMNCPPELTLITLI